MRSTTGIVAGAVGVVVALILVMLLIVVPGSDTDCGPDNHVPPPPQTGNCMPTGSPAEQGLRPGALGVLRCVAQRFGFTGFVGVTPGTGDHSTGRAVDFLLDGRGPVPYWNSDEGRTFGDRVVEYLRSNAVTFDVAYVIWRARVWTPGLSGSNPGAWQPLPDAGSVAVNRLDRIQVTVRSDSSSGPSPVARVGTSRGPVDDAGRVQPGAERYAPIAGPIRITTGFAADGGQHHGVDFVAPAGTPILAAADGKVVASGPAAGFGNWVVIDSIAPDGAPYSTVYGHMEANDILVHPGDVVRAGQHIAGVGSAGESTGPHLHFEVVPGGRLAGGESMDPIAWLQGAAVSSAPLASYGDTQCYTGFGSAGADLAAGAVPRNLVAWYRRAGSLCPEIAPSLLAAQGKQESGFQQTVVSAAGAVGPAQFLPSTAAAIDPDDGQPYVIDADGSGRASPLNFADAIVGQGRYMCRLAHQIEQWKAQGRVSGDTVALALAAYNAGLGAVLGSGGMPDLIPAHYSETLPYVRSILSMEPAFRARGSFGEFEPDTSVGTASGEVLRAVRQWLGMPYVFGGGGPQGPSGGGFDMAGLTSAAVSAATKGTVALPRTAEEQWGFGTEVLLRDVRPGDLIFGDFGPSGPSTVGVYAGNRSMVIAESGAAVAQVPMGFGVRARRIG